MALVDIMQDSLFDELYAGNAVLQSNKNLQLVFSLFVYFSSCLCSVVSKMVIKHHDSKNVPTVLFALCLSNMNQCNTNNELC